MPLLPYLMVACCFLLCFLPLATSAQITAEQDISSLSVTPAGGPAQLQWTLAPGMWLSSGWTEYQIDFGGWFYTEDLSDSIAYRGRSKLEFPLDDIMIGPELRLIKSDDRGQVWDARLGLYINVNDPDHFMLDHDWIEVGAAGFNEKVSYTESRAESKHMVIDAWLTRRLLAGRKFSLGITAGLQYQRILQDEIGYDGWQLTTEGREPVSGAEKAIVYEIKYLLPGLGMQGQWRPNRYSVMELRVVPLAAFVWDRDDHVLRHKEMKASPTGSGVTVGLSGRVEFRQKGGLIPFLGLAIETSELSAKGTQTQTWYADETYEDPTSGETVVVAQKGTTISDIEYKTKLKHVRVGIQAGIMF
ncbi:MAG: hypothetical protein ABIE70_09520 [bacterium]